MVPAVPATGAAPPGAASGGEGSAQGKYVGGIKLDMQAEGGAVRVRLVSHVGNRIRQLTAALYVTKEVLQKPLHIVWKQDKYTSVYFAELFTPPPGVTIASKGPGDVDPPFRGSFTKLVTQWMNHFKGAGTLPATPGWAQVGELWEPVGGKGWSRMSDDMFAELRPSLAIGAEVERLKAEKRLGDSAVSVMLSTRECAEEDNVCTSMEDIFQWVDRASAELEGFWAAMQTPRKAQIFVASDEPEEDLPPFVERYGAERVFTLGDAFLAANKEKPEVIRVAQAFACAASLEVKGTKGKDRDPIYTPLAFQLWRVAHGRRETCGPSSADSFCCGSMPACRTRDPS